MNNEITPISINPKKEYHDCEMIFRCYLDEKTSHFTIDEKQHYHIYTTLEEVKILNEALHIYQEKGFKEKFLLFSNAINPKEKYPDFIEPFNKVHLLGKLLQSLAKDRYSLTQLQEYTLEQAPTYKDDFMLNKEIIAIIINGEKIEAKGYEELQQFLAKNS